MNIAEGHRLALLLVTPCHKLVSAPMLIQLQQHAMLGAHITALTFTGNTSGKMLDTCLAVFGCLQEYLHRIGTAVVHICNPKSLFYHLSTSLKIKRVKTFYYPFLESVL